MQQKVGPTFLHTNVVRDATPVLHSWGHTTVLRNLRLRMQHLLQIYEKNSSAICWINNNT